MFLIVGPSGEVQGYTDIDCGHSCCGRRSLVGTPKRSEENSWGDLPGKYSIGSSCNVSGESHRPLTPILLKSITTHLPLFSGLQKGPAERGHVKKRQKSSKSVKKFFDTFRRFSRRAKNVKNRQKVSKNIFDIFRQFSRGTSFPAPFGGL